jgi:iron(III) transport system permease protein
MAFIFTYNGTFIYGTLAILILAYVTQFLPFTTRALSAPVMQLDKGMDEAGKILGAYTMRRVLWITAPIVRAAVFSAWLIAFTRGIRELNVSIFLYTPATIVMPVLIWNYMEQGTFSQAAALSLLQLFAMLFLVAIAERLGRRFESV